jgi:hypothetical protein
MRFMGLVRSADHTSGSSMATMLEVALAVCFYKAERLRSYHAAIRDSHVLAMLSRARRHGID